ncbi:hypothetical protein QRD02_04120 [Aequorivita sp. SDUM287046]|uniref:Outer membrane protein beta-barrel domain-containing protein n=1 Tax=Aequorivita aurantiaca TaxID=3053356 RepID=A0ABT8DE46_9FLAO|nr:hypothetical protein [Aequorivita aurantiaca]MDN3723556.1 hypothetical protein [Aequorivita aurantiaca]
MKTLPKIPFIFSIIFFSASLFLYAQEEIQPQEQSSEWRFVIEPYIMLPNMSGETGIGELIPPVEVDASVGDIFGHLKMGAMLYMEATNETWAITSDVLYMKLGQDIETGKFITGGDVTMQQIAWEVAGLRRVAPWLDAGLALRLVSLDMEINTSTLLTNRNASTNETWVDPVFVARSQGIIHNNWIYNARGDFGGFGIGSDFTWQVQADFGYKFSELFQTSLGYRVIGIDYDSGSGSERFLYNVDTYGAVVRLGFNF